MEDGEKLNLSEGEPTCYFVADGELVSESDPTKVHSIGSTLNPFALMLAGGQLPYPTVSA